jgi:zinc transport system substrate-binding protein
MKHQTWKTRLTLLVSLPIALLVAGCNQSNQPEKANPPSGTVWTTFYPTTYFAQRIAGDHLDVHCPVPEDADAIFWTPEPEDITGYQKADMIILNGAEFEKWAIHANLPTDRVVNTADSFSNTFVTFQDVTHSHGPAGKHSHTGIDGHTWVDPVLAAQQAKVICTAMTKRWPEHRSDFEANYALLAKDLGALDQRFKTETMPTQAPAILASHPAYNYPARRYKWNLRNLNLDPETVPDESTLKQIAKTLKAFPAKYLLWESKPIPENEALFRTRFNLTSKVFSPAESKDPAKDYIQVMNENLDQIQPFFQPR